MFLKNKKILFLSVQTFGLEKKIQNKLEFLGAKVDYFDERPSNNIFTKGLIRLKRNIYEKKITKYYKKILKVIENETYDYLFVNRGEIVPSFFLEKFIIDHPTTHRIFYTWDSFRNHPHPITILDYFQDKSTFDPKDAEKYNIQLRPLFFFDSFREISNFSEKELKYDLLFLGTAHSDRYILTNKIVDWCESKGLKTFTFFYLQGKLIYFFKRFFDSTFKHFDYKKLSFKSLMTEEILELYNNSNVILDINHPNQNGLTMRTFEAIGAQKKLITTNKKIEKYDFYDSNNILIIDRDALNIDESFFKKKYKELPESIYESLSIEGWIKEIFSEVENKEWIKN